MSYNEFSKKQRQERYDTFANKWSTKGERFYLKNKTYIDTVFFVSFVCVVAIATTLIINLTK